MGYASMRGRWGYVRVIAGGLTVCAIAAIGLLKLSGANHRSEPPGPNSELGSLRGGFGYQPRMPVETSGLFDILGRVKPWGPEATLSDIAATWRNAAPLAIQEIDRGLADIGRDDMKRLELLFSKYAILNSEGNVDGSYQLLTEMRAWIEKEPLLAQASLYTVIFNQGVVAMRRGETENCIMCRGESSCILPIGPAAIHTNTRGSRAAIRHFTDYLTAFPDDLGARWLLNLAHMTLGEYPEGSTLVTWFGSTISSSQSSTSASFAISVTRSESTASTWPAGQ